MPADRFMVDEMSSFLSFSVSGVEAVSDGRDMGPPFSGARVNDVDGDRVIAPVDVIASDPFDACIILFVAVISNPTVCD